MSSVFSKLIDKTSTKYGIGQEQLIRGIVGVATTFYLIKIGYPLVKFGIKQYQKRKKETENIVQVSNRRKNDVSHIKINKSTGKATKSSVGLDREFIKQLIALLKIMVPGWQTREAGLLTCATLTLLARTFLSIYVATLEGQIVKRIVLRDVRGFSLMLARWFAIAFPATFVNSAIRYLEGRLALSFRGRLVEHAYKMYLSQQTYYRVAALDTRLGGAEQRLTDDLSELASSVAHLYSSLTKPLLDCALVCIALISFSSKMGAKRIYGPLLSCVVIALTGQILRLASPKFGQLVAEEASKRGTLREAHARISAHAEEIAFYGGHYTEHRYLTTAYKSLVSHLRRVLALKFWYVMLEQLLMKYVWSGTGLLVIAMPLLYTTVTLGSTALKADGDDGVSERTRYLTTSKNLLSSGADAVERLMSSYKELVALAGYAARVSEMLDVFKDAALCKYRRNIVSSPSKMSNGTTNLALENIIELKDGAPVIKGIMRESTDGSISLIDVPIVTPNCEIIVPRLTIHIKPGDHILITGPNGCGKSSLFRIISGLWPVYGGTLIRPAESYFAQRERPALFYIPQKPYMTVGCLRDQIIYPSESQTKKCSDQELLKLLEEVDLRSLAERETDGLDAFGDWDSTLSGGEKQRLAMTRLFYHAPQYALLDECTSAVSLEAEAVIYETAKKKGITLLTITHRVASLAKYHKLLLRFDGEGGWTFGPLDTQYLQAGRSFSPLLNIVVSLCKQLAPLFFFINLLKQKVIFTMSLCDCDDELEYKLLTRDKVEDALAIQAETMKQENLAIGLGMFEEDGAPEEMNLLFREVIKDGMTLIAVDKRTDEVAAVAFNKLRAKPRKGEKDELDSFIEENLKHQTCRKLIKFLDDIDNVDIFERYDTNGAMEVFYLGTDPRYQGRGIGRRMMQECIGFGRGLLNGTRRRTSIDGVILEQSVIPSIIFGVFASNYSQRIADKLGFHVLHEVRYDDYASNGRKMSERIGSVHKTARLQVLKL